MIYSPGLTWITICTMLTLMGPRVGAHELLPSFRPNEIKSLSKNQSSTAVNPVERNRRALEEMYLTRDREEEADPMNYLSKLYSDISETRGGPVDLTAGNTDGDETNSRIVDPPQMELVFHKKVPNCDNEFNISKIVELVDEDKRQRQCPCACPPKPSGAMQGIVQAQTNGSGGRDAAATPAQLHPTVLPPASRSNAQVAPLHSDLSKEKENSTTAKAPPNKSNAKPSAGLGTKKTDEKTKLKSNINPVLQKIPPRKISNVGIVDTRKNTVPGRQGLPRGATGVLAAGKTAPRQQVPAKPGHARLTDVRTLKQGISGGKNLAGKLAKQGLTADRLSSNFRPPDRDHNYNTLYK